jgi:membrane protein DedA with SNARE-associated domain
MSLTEIETWILNSLQSIFDTFGWLGVGGVMLFENATGITPSEVTLALAGWLLLATHDAPFGWVFLGALYASVGSTIGALAPYFIARWGGRPLVERFARWFRMEQAHIERAERLMQRWGPGMVFFGRLFPGVRSLVGLPAGLGRVHIFHYIGATFLGTYIWCALFIGIGYVVGHEWKLIVDVIKDYALYLLVFAAALASLTALFYWYYLRPRGWRPAALLNWLD